MGRQRPVGISGRGPHAAADRQVILVTGTNGKTTTTRLITSALSALGQEVASNAFGANMEAGLAAALGAAPEAPCAALAGGVRGGPGLPGGGQRGRPADRLGGQRRPSGHLGRCGPALARGFLV